MSLSNVIFTRILAIALIILPFLPSCQAGDVNATLITTDLLIPLNGTAPDNYLKLWEMSYTAVNYLPVCGRSTDSWAFGPVDWSNSNECRPAWLSFIKTGSQVQSSFYDLRGNVIDRGQKVIDPKSEGGEMKCLCFGIRHVKGRGVAYCMLVTAKGQITERDSKGGNGNAAVGLSGPDADDRKILPTCEEYAMKNGITNGTTNGGTNGSGSGTSNKAAAPATEEKKGLTTESIIGIAIGLPGAIVAIITMITYIRKQRRKRAARYNDVETGAVQKTNWAFWKRWRKDKTPVASTPAIPMSTRPAAELA